MKLNGDIIKKLKTRFKNVKSRVDNLEELYSKINIKLSKLNITHEAIKEMFEDYESKLYQQEQDYIYLKDKYLNISERVALLEHVAKSK